MGNKLYREEDVNAIAARINHNIGEKKAYRLRDMPDGVDEVYDAGKQAERNAFWDTIQNYGKRNVYYNAFTSAYYGNIWTDKIFNPKYEINCTGNIEGARNLFFSCILLTDIKVPVNVEGVFVSQSFCYCEKLKRIPLLKVNEQTTWQNSFISCNELQELTIEGIIGQNGLNLQWSTKLSKASFKSIVGACSVEPDENGVVPDYSMTFSLEAVNKAFETSEGANDGSTSAEWYEAWSSRMNWTFLLV